MMDGAERIPRMRTAAKIVEEVNKTQNPKEKIISTSQGHFLSE